MAYNYCAVAVVAVVDVVESVCCWLWVRLRASCQVGLVRLMLFLLHWQKNLFEFSLVMWCLWCCLGKRFDKGEMVSSKTIQSASLLPPAAIIGMGRGCQPHNQQILVFPKWHEMSTNLKFIKGTRMSQTNENISRLSFELTSGFCSKGRMMDKERTEEWLSALWQWGTRQITLLQG